ncbi:MAG: class B sortase [Lachnospiraceae bacterium]
MKKRKLIITAVGAAAIIASGFYAVKYKMDTNQAVVRLPVLRTLAWEEEIRKIKELSKEIIDMLDAVNDEVPVEIEDEEYKAPQELLNLMESNENVIGWLTIAGTNIDYPLMQKIEDNEYFLHRDIDGNESYPGSIYMDSNHRIDKNGLHILYGHNMKNGSMFKDVIRFMDKQYRNSHQDIKIYTKEKVFVLEPVFCYAARADGTYRSIIEQQEELEAFLLKKTGTKITADNIFVLITCSYGSEDERTYLIAREMMDIY